ncbi:Aldo/keto reductase [Penicillium viridicatum]|nr:Aldo/keto reductase [Penicillium viridicatum]
MPPPPPPKSALGRHRLLAPSASVRVSPLSLGGMSLGDNWKGMMGECTKEQAFELLDTYYDLGGNFIDTANMYQFGQSEEWIGEWLQKTGRRSEIVLATKYTLSPIFGKAVQQSNYGGTGTKSMRVAVDDSLKRLKTDYIDLYYVHAWDFATSIPELMQSLNTLVQQGKVLYLGISDTPAWVVTKANAYAREHGLRPFSVYQGRYSAIMRDLERDIIPMARDEGMAIHPWGVLGSGYIRSPDAAPKEGGRQTPHVKTGREEQVSAALDTVAKRHEVPITSVALAYVLQKAPYIFPMVGGNKVSHLKSNIEALRLELTAEDVAEIDNGYEFDLGFPHNFLNLAGFMPQGPQHVSFLSGRPVMSLLRKPMKQYHWLPGSIRNIYEWLHYSEPTWGYTIYRTTSTPQSNAAFLCMVDLTTKYMKDGFYNYYESSRQYNSRANEFNITPWDKIWPNYQPRVIEDASQFDGASIDQLREHFRAEATERDVLDEFPGYRMFIVIDEESFQTLQNAPPPEKRRYYVKLVEALGVDPYESFPGWMKCSLPSFEVWSDMQDGAYMKDSYSMRPDGTDVL